MALLDGIKGPDDVKRLAASQIPELLSEVRRRIVDVTLQNGGHMASSLGAVEIVTALLRVFTPERDRIIFDVGHQAYAWKILTGRNERFDTLRREGGICGFPRMDESEYDHFGVGHSSTSLSAALGYATASDLKKEDHHVVAVIGDGALINGEAFEALNHAGSLETRVIFILNDNEMSISPRVGGMALHLARLSTSPLYKGTKNVVKSAIRRLIRSDRVYRAFESAKNTVKKAVSHGNLFNDMGLTYWGPFDGHDEPRLERVFELAKSYDGPLLIHVITKKGRGYTPAEANPVAYHGVPPAGRKSDGVSWSRAVAECIEKMAARDPRRVVLTPAMAEGSSLTHFKQVFPDRFFDVGIAEEHMLTFAAGLAAGGLRPIACIYSTFLQRAMDQLVHDISLQKLPVIIAVDRAGLIGEDGETHQGLFDQNWSSVIPNLQVWAPFDRASLATAFDAAEKSDGPVLIRYARGSAPEKLLAEAIETPMYSLQNDPSSWCVVSVGSTAEIAVRASGLAGRRGLEKPTLLCLNRVEPLPDGVFEILRDKKSVVCIEEAYVRGGVGEHLTALAVAAGMSCRFYTVGMPTSFAAQGTPEQQRKRFGLTAERIVDIYERENCQKPARSATG